MIEIENMLNNLVEHGWFEQKNFISLELVKKLKKELSERECKSAGIGEMKLLHKDVRNDKIHWLEKCDKSLFVKEYLHLLNELQYQLNKGLYLGLQDYELHFAQYEAGGFYKPHYDNLKGKNRRAITVITYLNESWTPADGGCLNIHIDSELKEIAPQAGSMVIFLSDKILHEVTLSMKSRLSITGWFLRG